MTRYSRVIGTGGYLPEEIRTNDDISQMVDTSDSWIFERTGIKSRRIAGPNETASSMAEAAARVAISAAQIDAEDIDMIIVATGTPDRVYPSTGCLLQKRLGIKNCVAFDIQAACSGAIYALSIADQYIKSGAAQKILVVGTELCSRITDWTDRGTCILFGDGAGAVLLEWQTKRVFCPPISIPMVSLRICCIALTRKPQPKKISTNQAISKCVAMRYLK